MQRPSLLRLVLAHCQSRLSVAVQSLMLAPDGIRLPPLQTRAGLEVDPLCLRVPWSGVSHLWSFITRVAESSSLMGL